MATVSNTADDPLAVSAWAVDGDAESKSERYLAKRLAAAAAEYKSVTVTTFLLAAGVAALLWLGCGVVAEHWLVPGGLPPRLRWAWLAVGFVGLAAAAVRWLWPLFRYRVNLVYAARILEEEHPGLHNDVVNAVLAQAHADEATPLIVRSLRRRAARQLTTAPGDGAVDRGPALRLAYTLAALVVAAVIYELAAPKSLVVSATRLLAPWLSTAAPSRVRIAPPTLSWHVPGMNASADEHRLQAVGGVVTLIRGRQLLVETEVDGLSAAEKPQAIVRPLDDAGPEWTAPLVPAAGGRYSVVLPDPNRGLDQSIDLVLSAGDARLEPIRVAVVDEPAMLVREIRYDYPDYTGQPDETVPWQGDIRAIEGTQVTLTAECNHPLEAAWIDLGCDGKRDGHLTVDPKDLARGRGSFTLRLTPERSAPEFSRYRLMFQPKAASLAGREPTIVDKMEHRIDVIPDLAPEVSIEEPVEKTVRVPPDAPLTVRVRASDPDFGLASVTVETRLAGGPGKPGPELLVGARTTFRGAATLVPAELGAGPGAAIEYRAVAKDTRPTQPNIAASEWQKLVIDPSAPPRQPPPADRDTTDPGDGDNGQPGEPGEGGSSKDGAPPDGSSKDGQSKDGMSKDGMSKDGAGKAGEGASKPEQGSEGAPQERGGEQKNPSGESGGQGDPTRSKRPSDPSKGQQQGDPQEGKQQGSAEGGKPQDGQQGKAGDKPGQRQQPGSQDGAGAEPKGEQGSQQQGGRPGERSDGGTGGQMKPSGPGQQQGAGQGPGKEGGRQPGGGESGKPSGEKGAGSERGGGTDQASQQGKGKRDGAGASGAKPKDTVSSDGTDDGEAMERILEHRRQQGGGAKPSDTGTRGGESTEQGRQGDAPSGQKPDGTAGQSGQQPKQPSGDPPPACAGADGQPCGKEGCSSCNGGQAGGSSGTSGEGAGQTSGEGKSGEGKAGEGKAGEGKAGEGKAGEGKAGEGKAGEGKSGEGKSGEGKAGEGKAGEGKAGEGKAGEGKAGEGKAGEGKAGEGKAGEGKAGEGSGDAAGDEPQQTGGQPAGGSKTGGGAFGGTTGAGGGDPQAAREDREMEWSEQDLSHARNAADLAIEHLKNAVESGDASVLDELGWTPEQAQAFLARWEAMRRMARSGDARQRGEFEQVLKSLGIRPEGVRSSRVVPKDAQGGQAEGRRSRPPSDYREQFKAFMQGAAPE